MIHQLRNTLKYLPKKDEPAIFAELKQVYQALTLAEAEGAFQAFKENWEKKYPLVVRSWEANWAELTAYFRFPAEIRRLIYTTNTIEGYHRQLRKVTKTKTAYPTDDALRKIIYLATMEVVDPCHAELEHVSGTSGHSVSGPRAAYVTVVPT